MLRRFIYLLVPILFVAYAFAQDAAPNRSQTQAAVLADMSRRTGETVTISSLNSQQWHYGSYDFVRNIGCPLAPAAPATSGNWQRFVFNYRGMDYIYLVSDNLQSLILCNESALPTAIPSPIPATITPQGSGQSGGGFVTHPTITPQGLVQPTATLPGSGQTGGGVGATATPSCILAPRLRLNSWGNVTPGDPNWLHAEPSRNAEKIGEIPAGHQFMVMAGPVCDAASGMNYWQVDYDGSIGWTSEGFDSEYWLLPLYNQFMVETINRAFVPDWAHTIPANNRVAFSPDVELMLLLNAPNQLHLIRLNDNSIVETFDYGDSVRVTTLRFSPIGYYIVIGLSDGGVDIARSQDAFIYEPFALLTHEDAITALAVNTSEELLAVADEARILTFWAIQSPNAPLHRIELPEVAGDLEFSLNNRTLIVRDIQGRFLTALQAP